MKKTILLFCFIFCISCSERKADSNPVTAEQQAEQQKEADSPFNPALRKAIGEFIDLVENNDGEWDGEKWEKGKVYLIWAHKVGEIPVLSLRNNHWYYDGTQYYYIDGDHLILYSGLWDENNYLSGMIDVSKMTEFRDSIPGFDRYLGIDEEYNEFGRDFRIISPDSLRTMGTGLARVRKTAPRITPE